MAARHPDAPGLGPWLSGWRFRSRVIATSSCQALGRPCGRCRRAPRPHSQTRGRDAAARGAIRFDAESIGGRPAERLVAQGLSLVPEGRRIFGSLSVAENITLGATPRRDRQAVAADLERMLTLFPILRERFRQKAGKL